MSHLINCPFCAEAIQPAARKCKHCGEWLDGSGPLRASTPVTGVDPQTFSETARAVSKGMKERQRSEGTFTLLTLIAAGAAIGAFAWLKNVLPPGAVFFAFLALFVGFVWVFVLLRRGYYDE